MQIALTAEGSAMLVGNNVFDRDGKTYLSNVPTYLKGRGLTEWKKKSSGSMKLLNPLLICMKLRKKKPPSENEYFEIISKQGWVATPENGFLFGNVYRVGAQMLLDIKNKNGDKDFYEALSDSSKLIEYWKKNPK